MKKTEKLFLGLGLVLILGVIGAIAYNHHVNAVRPEKYVHNTTKFGAFLAAQHAIYVNDFNAASEFANVLSDVDYRVVTSTRYMADFLSGKLPSGAELLKDEKTVPSQLIYDTYLMSDDKWDELYSRHKKDSSALAAQLRIWSSVATGHQADALKFVDGLPAVKSWKEFIRGQIYAETGDIDNAVKSFAMVETNFMNISDYLYLMSFYISHDMSADADALRRDFTRSPGGMFVLGYENIPDWSEYSGYKNALAFGLIQTVSHTQVMMYSDLSILLLRMAQIVSENGGDKNAINYYLGHYFFNNRGDWKTYFDKIDKNSPFFAFAGLRAVERSGDVRVLDKIVRDNPLFVPAINSAIANHIKQGERRAALRIINRSLAVPDLTESARSFFLKNRARIYFAFGDYDAAQRDLHTATGDKTLDSEIMSLQAKIWAAQNRNLEDAYEYAMTLVHRNPVDIIAWETLGRVIAARESASDALELISRVGDVANSCSSLFDLLGDLYVATGQVDNARDAYTRAIEYSDDGLIVVDNVNKKLRKLK